MSFLTKIIAMFMGLGVLGDGAQAASLCRPDAAGIDLIEGRYNPPAFIKPDVEQYKGHKMPEDIIVQGWHNLRAASRPLTVVCRYKGKPSEAFTLPNDTNACELTYNGGRVFQCYH